MANHEKQTTIGPVHDLADSIIATLASGWPGATVEKVYEDQELVVLGVYLESEVAMSVTVNLTP